MVDLLIALVEVHRTVEVRLMVVEALEEEAPEAVGKEGEPSWHKNWTLY